ncbi:MAG: ATP-dependent 6-phosphofructokinase [Acidimicrobiales bacterium]
MAIVSSTLDRDRLPFNASELPEPAELVVAQVGPRRYPSPLRGGFVSDGPGVLVSSNPTVAAGAQSGVQAAFEEAGPRAQLFVDPQSATAAIVTCGGLCPGLNDVIHALVNTLHGLYGCRRVLGFRYGFAGLVGDPRHPPLPLTPEGVEGITHHGGTLLGTSRGPQDPARMVDALQELGVDMLFCVGGDGTLRGASALAAEIAARGAEIAVVAVPKTIDNDIYWVERCFGFATAVEEAVRAVAAAHAEARSAWHGVGVVKLMGRHSGFIAAHAALASGCVNFCLVPEQPFSLSGPGGLLDALERRLSDRGHAVVVVAEGAGQELLGARGDARDASGNRRLGDIGVFLRDELARGLDERGLEPTVKYLDPSYAIRSLTANAFDAEFCAVLAQHAVHAALAGRTDMVVGYWHHHFTHLPIRLAAARRLRLDLASREWQRVLQRTGQPARLIGTTAADGAVR